MSDLDLTKPLQTRDGREVRIYATDGSGDWSIHGAIREDGRGWFTATWMNDGKYATDTHKAGKDLINLPQKGRVKAWLNVYYAHNTTYHASRADADAEAALIPARIACIEVGVEYTEGEGL